MRRAAKIDGNQTDVVAVLRAIGAMVQSLAAVGGGVPDLLVYFRGRLLLLEVKDESQPPSKRRLTPDQVKWHQFWPVTIVKSPGEALEAVQRLTA